MLLQESSRSLSECLAPKLPSQTFHEFHINSRCFFACYKNKRCLFAISEQLYYAERFVYAYGFVLVL